VKTRRLRPYIRRLHAGDYSDSLRTLFQIRWAREYWPRAFVVAQRGTRHVMAVGRTKRELMKSLIGVSIEARRRRRSMRYPVGTKRDFASWSKLVQRRAFE
jgi:hypothetical protein